MSGLEAPPDGANLLQVDREILRGVSLHQVLQRPAVWLRPSRYRGTERSEELWSTSRQVAARPLPCW